MTSYLRLEPACGPECPRCGCRDAEILQRPISSEMDADPKRRPWWPTGKARCRHCGMQFAFREIPAPPQPPELPAYPEPATDPPADGPHHQPYPVRACPECGSPSVVVTSSPRPRPGQPRIRHHRCKDCAATFKSVDDRQLEPEAS